MRTRILLGGMFTFLILGADNQVLPQPKSATDPLVPELPAPNPKSGFQRLKKEREALNRERDGATQDLEPKSDPLPAERAKLMLQMAELLKRLNERKSNPPFPEGNPPLRLPGDESRSIDPLNQAQSLYRSGNYEASLRAFRLVDSSSLTTEDRAFVQYMIASCLRRQGKLSESAAIYREVADAREDAFVAECAVWQLSNIRWRNDLESQLEELRQRRKAR